jgi:hypothetical protein
MNDQRLMDLYRLAHEARASETREGCPDPERLLALARREGSEAERLEMLDHAMTCTDCQRELELLRAIEKAGARMAGAGSRAPQRPMLSWRIAGPLALAASLMLAVGIATRNGGPGERTDDPSRGGDSHIVLHSPRDIALTPGDERVVAWRPVPTATSYIVEVLDENGQPVLVNPTADTTFVFRDVSRLVAGREYRWWVRAVGPGDQRSSVVGRLRFSAR